MQEWGRAALSPILTYVLLRTPNLIPRDEMHKQDQGLILVFWTISFELSLDSQCPSEIWATSYKIRIREETVHRFYTM